METKNSRIETLAIDLIAAFLSFFAVVGTSMVAATESKESFLMQLRMGDMVSERFFGIWSFVLLLFILFSVVRAVYFYRSAKKAAFLATHEGELSLSGACLSVLQAASFWIELAVMGVLFFALPAETGLCHVAVTFFGAEAQVSKLTLWLIFLPILMFILFVDYLIIHRQWKQKKEFSFREQKESKWKPVLKTAIVCVFYFFASIIFPYLLPMAISFWGILQVAWVEILIGGAALTVVATVLANLRVIRKRRKFMNKLRSLCLEKGFVLTEVHSAGGVFRSKKGHDLSIVSGGKEYRCKFVAGKFRHSPLAFTEKGQGVCGRTVRFFKWEIFHWTRKIDYAFESENTKVIILLPRPEKFYVGMAGEKLMLADTGDMVGDYQIFTATGFLGALERNCIGICRA